MGCKSRKTVVESGKQDDHLSGNLEVPGNLTAVRELSGKNLARENCLLLTSHLGLHHC